MLAAYLLHEGNWKEHKIDEEEKNEGQGRDPDESDARYWIRKYQLEWKHKEELKQPDAWLGDEHLNAAMDILWHSKLNHKGFQRSVYSIEQNKSVTRPCLQQLFVRGNYWALALMNPHQSYCTLYDSARHLSRHGFVKHIVLLQRAIDVEETCMEWAEVQQQSDGSSCGLYAIVYAVDIANDIDPKAVRYDEKNMRSHLLYCLDRDMLKPFQRFT
jgi:hypothetical protein